MRSIDTKLITETLIDLIGKACCNITPDALKALKTAFKNESSENAKFALELLIKNAQAAKENSEAVCQDTGMAVVFLEIGQDIILTGKLLNDAVNEGVETGYALNNFRMSVLDPITRINTKTNTPAVIYTEITAGDKIKISFMPKGFGSENMSKLYMLTPAEGIDAGLDKIIEAVQSAGSNPCPPVVVGVGLGGTAEYAMLLAKKALLRKIGTKNADDFLNGLEEKLLKRINGLNIGPQGFKGNTTALAVHIEKFPTHISSLPVAVNIQCNCVRAGTAII